MARVGMKHLVFATIGTESATTAPTYGSPGLVLGRAVRGSRTPNRYDGKLYGDDGIAESYNGVRDMTVEVETTELVEASATTLGIFKTVGTGDNTVYRTTDKPTAFGGCGWVETHIRKGVTSYVGFWIYKTQLATGTQEAKTKGENLEYGTETLTGTALPAFADSDGDSVYTETKVFTTLSSAISWLDGLANIPAS